MKTLLLIIGASIVLLLPVAQPTVSQTSLDVLPAQHDSKQLTVYQEQGGNRQHLQDGIVANAQQRANAVVQGNQEDEDNLQPALGYNALNWQMQ